jgi:hypothetical protein
MTLNLNPNSDLNPPNPDLNLDLNLIQEIVTEMPEGHLETVRGFFENVEKPLYYNVFELERERLKAKKKRNTRKRRKKQKTEQMK